MCRIAGYVGNSEADLQLLADRLSKAALRDIVAEKSGMKGAIHPDGWGYAIHSDGGTSFYKTEKPIYMDRLDLPKTEGKIYAVFHARKASKKETIKRRFSHPFLAETEDSYIFLAHNGQLDHEKEEELKEQLNIDRETVDSEVALRYIVTKDLSTATSDLEKSVAANSALNLLILQIKKDGGSEVYVKHYYRRERNSPDRSEYYRLLKQKLPGGIAVFSSTLNEYGMAGTDLGKDGLVPISLL